MASVEDLLKKQKCIRVFGYGSLIWKPDFEYDNMHLGYIEGYERRFWQGSTHHRGTPEKPGRVLTLTKNEEGRCWGVVYEVTGSEKIKSALDYLETRERILGGYDVVIVPVLIPEADACTKSLISILYYATPQNDLFLGDGKLNDIAGNIASARGICGYNCEYLLRIADFLRAHLPDETEPHLYELDRLVRIKLGLGTNNVLPWTSLITMETFHKKLQRLVEPSESEQTDDMSSALQPVLA